MSFSCCSFHHILLYGIILLVLYFSINRCTYVVCNESAWYYIVIRQIALIFLTTHYDEFPRNRLVYETVFWKRIIYLHVYRVTVLFAIKIRRFVPLWLINNELRTKWKLEIFSANKYLSAATKRKLGTLFLWYSNV